MTVRAVLLAFGTLAQAAGLLSVGAALAAGPGVSAATLFGFLPSREFDMVLGLCVFLGGAVLVAWPLEVRVRRRGRSANWTLAALAGPAGVAAVLALRPAAQAGAAGEAEPAPLNRRMRDRIAGTILCVGLSAGVTWGVARCLRADAEESETDPAGIPAREARAYENLKRMAEAQARYVQRDWDGDGKLTYALAPVHLWQSVRAADGVPVPVRLIPRDLAFAQAITFALDGYVFDNVYNIEVRTEPPADSRARPRPGPARPIDHEREWAGVAFPKYYQRTGLLVFLVDKEGTIFARDYAVGGVPDVCPLDPAGQGWHEIRATADLHRLQGQADYQQKLAVCIQTSGH